MTGSWLDRTTQRWVRVTGRSVVFDDLPWLRGPVGAPDYIGDSWVDSYRFGFGAANSTAAVGVLPNMSVLDGEGFSSGQLHSQVRAFYEKTSDWRLEVWSRWSPLFRPVGALLAVLFSRRLQQLNLPLDPLDTSGGMTSSVRLVLAKDGSVLGSSWQRTLRATGQTLFGGLYGVADLPGERRPSIRVVFPLPNGSITVFLRPESGSDGRLRLLSDGSCWGEVGAYLVVADRDTSRGWARRVPLPEQFDVFVDDEGTLRADHQLRFGSREMIRFHYRLDPIGKPAHG